MKKLALTALFVVLSLSLMPATESPGGTLQMHEGSGSAPLGADELAVLEAALVFPTIPECGDFCTTPGVSRGCIDRSGGSPQKTFCTCIGNTWTC